MGKNKPSSKRLLAQMEMDNKQALPDHLNFENKDAVIVKMVDRKKIPLNVEELLIVEYYSRQVSG